MTTGKKVNLSCKAGFIYSWLKTEVKPYTKLLPSPKASISRSC